MILVVFLSLPTKEILNNILTVSESLGMGPGHLYFLFFRSSTDDSDVRHSFLTFVLLWNIDIKHIIIILRIQIS